MSRILQYAFSQHLYSFDTDGWFNATEAAARFGKVPFDWLSQRETVEYMIALVRHMGQTGGQEKNIKLLISLNCDFVPELEYLSWQSLV